MTSDDLARLRALAEGATPGPWNVACEDERAEVVDDGDNRPYVMGKTEDWPGWCIAACIEHTEPDPSGRANAAHIAAFDPTTVLALLDALEEAREAVAVIDEAKLYPDPEPAARTRRVIGHLRNEALIARKQRDEARAEVERLRGLRALLSDGVDIVAEYAPGYEVWLDAAEEALVEDLDHD